jgi:prevent-host-death family protein
MKTISMRELLHHSAEVLRVVERGGTVRLTKRGRPVARLIPEPEPTGRQVVKVDFREQLRATWGDKAFSQAQISAMREAELGERS